MKPIIKWAGGKTQLIEEIEKRMPKKYNKYIEPFFGGGALYFYLEPKKATINDVNRQLINCYIQVRDNYQELIIALNGLQEAHDGDEFYYEIRELYNKRMFNKELDVNDAAYTIYLNKSGFNGLYRVNSDGLFNTPSGKKRKVNLYDKKNIMSISKQLQNTKIMCSDFEDSCKYLHKGDFVFFDSPYYDTFDTYQKGGFTEEDHLRLAKLFDKLSKRGVYCMLTNSDTDFIKNLYSKYSIDVVNVKRMINCNGEKRTGREVIVTNY